MTDDINEEKFALRKAKRFDNTVVSIHLRAIGAS